LHDDRTRTWREIAGCPGLLPTQIHHGPSLFQPVAVARHVLSMILEPLRRRSVLAADRDQVLASRGGGALLRAVLVAAVAAPAEEEPSAAGGVRTGDEARGAGVVGAPRAR